MTVVPKVESSGEAEELMVSVFYLQTHGLSFKITLEIPGDLYSDKLRNQYSK
jgi:hypothetical protein